MIFSKNKLTIIFEPNIHYYRARFKILTRAKRYWRNLSFCSSTGTGIRSAGMRTQRHGDLHGVVEVVGYRGMQQTHARPTTTMPQDATVACSKQQQPHGKQQSCARPAIASPRAAAIRTRDRRPRCCVPSCVAACHRSSRTRSTAAMPHATTSPARNVRVVKRLKLRH